MKYAIDQIKQLIQYYENERDKNLRFYETEEFRENTIGDRRIVIEQTNRVYNELIDELQRAILIIEEAEESDEDPEEARRIERIRQTRLREL